MIPHPQPRYLQSNPEGGRKFFKKEKKKKGENKMNFYKTACPSHAVWRGGRLVFFNSQSRANPSFFFLTFYLFFPLLFPSSYSGILKGVNDYIKTEIVSILKITLATTSLSNILLSLPSSEALPVAPGLLFKLPHADLPPGCDSPPSLPAASSGSWSSSSSV